MFDGMLTLLAQSAPAEAVRASHYGFALVNAAHLIGLATLFGSILAMDLRLLGLFPTVPAQPLARTLPMISLAGLALAIPTGLLMFSLDPQFYAANPAFLTKITLIGLGVIHAGSMPFSRDWHVLMFEDGTVHPRLRVTAILSLTIWTSAICAGRMIAFVGSG